MTGAQRPGAARATSRVRTQWLALGAALVVLAGLLVGWALTRAADRVEVLQVARPLLAGDVLDAGDLAVTMVAVDAGVSGLVPPSSRDALLGRVAAVDLQPGSLLVAGMWREAPALIAGERSVGAVLPPGHYPAGLARGDVALAAAIEATVGAGGGTSAPPVAVRVIDVRDTDVGDLGVTLAVPAADAVTIARLAAAEELVLVGQPSAGADS